MPLMAVIYVSCARRKELRAKEKENCGALSRRSKLPQQSSWPLLTPLLFATIYLMSGLHLTGYRPLVTRRIGQERHAERNAQASSLKPIDDAYGQSSEEISQLAPRPEPEHGFSAWSAYEEDEVLLDDLARRAEPPHALPPPRPLTDCLSADRLSAYLVTIRDAGEDGGGSGGSGGNGGGGSSDSYGGNGGGGGGGGGGGAALPPQPSTLEHGGETYVYDGYLLLAQLEGVAPPASPPPPAQFALGVALHAASFAAVRVPPALQRPGETPLRAEMARAEWSRGPVESRDGES